jgi:Alpha/beta hydrolase domain/PEGA domain
MTTPSIRSFRVCVVPAFLILTLMAATAPAEVERIEITSREILADGMEFGDTGAYEKIRGTLFYAVDPANSANAAIVDLELAPLGADGKVHFQGDFLLLKPVDLARGNGRLLYDVNNRGNLYMLRHINGGTRTNDPSTPEDAGNGFLMEQGYSLLWSAWNWDVVSGDDRLQIEFPIATDGGAPIRERIAAEIVVSFALEPAPSMPLAWGGSRCYPALDPTDNSNAVLTVRDAPTADRRTIPNDRWSYSRIENGVTVPDPTSLSVDGGLQPGKIYELIYEVQNPRVVGLGLAAVRDAVAFFHFEGSDRYGNPNPLAARVADGLSKTTVDLAYIFGVSQSGRFIVHMLWQGFHIDEENRMVFEGARIHVAGGGKGGFNHRFAQTTHHPSDLEGNYFPADHPPFNFLPDGSPVENDVLAEAKRLGRMPKIIMTNNTLEYWTRAASLVHTDPTGTTDAALHPDVRYYMTNGAPHGGTSSRTRTVTEHERNPLGVAHVQRAMLVNLDAWLSDGIEPPPSRYPRIDRGELITASDHAGRFPAIPGMRHPGRNLQPPRVDYGADFWTDGVFTTVPPDTGPGYSTLVPAFDADGNGVGGIRLPELTAPLGTYQGWNPRSEVAGAPDYLTRFDGSFWAFAATEAERGSAGDPRPSVESRYAGRQDYVNRVAAEASQLSADGILLQADADRLIDLAGRIAWPPTPIDSAPFWKLGADRLQPSAVLVATAAPVIVGPISSGVRDASSVVPEDTAPVEATSSASIEPPPEIVVESAIDDAGVDAETAPVVAKVTATAVTAEAVSFAGGVQISAEAGLGIHLDGEFVGRTTAMEDGLYLAGLKKGRHVIRVEKEGYLAQTFEVDVVNRPIEVEVAKFLPVPISAAATGGPQPPTSTEVGSLVVTSAPQNITVEIDGRVEEKRTPQLSIGGLPVGDHVITFRKEGYEPVTSTITIEQGAENSVHGDLKSTRVEVVRHGMGSLRLISKPMKCTIWFRDEIHDKAYDRFNLTKIPAGEYPMMVMIQGRKLTTTVLIVDGQRTTVEVSFMKGDDPFVITRVQK